MSISATTITFKPTPPMPPSLNFQRSSFPIHLTTTTITPTKSSISLPSNPTFRSRHPFLFLAFSSAGGDNIHNSGGGGGNNNNNNNNNNDGDDNNNNRSREEAIMVIAEAGRTVDSLPKDLRAAIEDRKIPGSIVLRYFELESSPLLSWLLKFGGFKERLLADDLFLAKVAMECGVGIFTKTAAEYERRRENFFQELEIVFADVVALPGTSYSLLQRLGAILGNGAKLFAVGTTSSLVGTVITNTLINARKAVDKSAAEEVENVPVLSTSVAYGVYMAVSSNIRYQVLAGIIEQRILEPLLHQHKLILTAICFAVRTGNTYLGSLLWVDYARWVGIQKAQELES